MLIDDRQFDIATGSPVEWRGETAFRGCYFAEMEIAAATFEGQLLWCGFDRVEWYWATMFTATIVRSRFEDCVFRGASFGGCYFVACTFVRNRFLVDNLGGACTFNNCIMAECVFEDCTFTTAHPSKHDAFEATRWYGCTQTGCTGLEKMF